MLTDETGRQEREGRIPEPLETFEMGHPAHPMIKKKKSKGLVTFNTKLLNT